MPNSNAVHSSRDGQNNRVDYFTEILKKTGRLNHSIAVGDICAIRDPEGTKAVPLENEQWIIGQVLVLFIRRESLDKSTFHVRVRRLARWKGEGENFANKKELKSFEQRGFFRPEQALLETIRVETHPLKNIFPVDIHIIDSKELLTEDRAKTSFDAVTQSHELKLSCPARIDKNDVLHDARKDWKSYQKQRTESSDPPYVLRSGWELMQEDLQLIEALKKAWTRRSTNVFSVDAPSTGKENKRTREGSQRKSILGNKKIKRSSQSVQFAPGTKPSSRSRLSKQADDAVSDYSNDASSVQDSTNFRDTVSQASSDALMSMSVESTSRHPTPFGTVYKTQKKAREKAGYETTYVEAVEMDVEKEAVALGLRNKLVEPRWQVRVGDIIILQCEGTGPPNKSFFAGKSKWYPFTVPWSVAQVVAIYYSNNDEEEMKMEVRWFYRPDELDLEAKKAMSSKQRTELLSGLFHSRQLVEIDEHITEAPVESALGLARMTSEANPSKDWFRLHVHPSVLEIGFICRFMYFFKNDDSQLHAVGDWTNYGALSSAPLYRGLKCPKCKPGKDTKLFKRYQERLCRRFRIPELTASVVDDDYAEETISFLEWASGEMDCARATCSAADAYYTSQHFEFFSSIRIEIVKDRCDARSMAKKSENQEIEVAVGELVCIACGVERANRQDRKTEKMWSPFKGPFTYAQVLTIYRNVAESESPLLLEIRHFHRRKEVNHVSEIYLPRSCAREDEEDVYESFETEVISAGRVLGVADLYLGLHTEKFNMSSMGLVSSRSGMLRPKCRCAYYCTKSAVQPIFCADSSSRKWSRRLMERGLSASRMIQEDSNLESSVEFCLGITISARFSEEKGMFQSLVPEAKCASDPTPLCSKQIDAEEVFFFPKATADIPWSSFEDENHLCPSRDRNDCSWTVCVGQIVAIRSDQVPSDSFYKHGWEPAQILAIQGNNDDLKKMKYHFKVRTLRRCLKLAALNSFPGRLSESDEMLIKTVHASSLLGPVYVATEKGVPFVWESVLRFLPANVLVYEGSRPFDFSAFVMRGLEMSSCYSSSELARLYDSLERELPGFSKVQKSCQDEVVIETAQTLMEPVPRGQLYSDTNGTTYYSRVVVEPSMESFSEDIWESKKRVDAPWNVEIGDSVAVHCQHGCGPAKFGRALQNSEKVGKYGITKEPFGYCEVVAIFVASPEDNEDGESSQVELEIRWLYRVPEINRSASSTYNEDFTNDCEEVFESDHYDIIPASALYFPIILHDTKFPLGQRKFHLGLPVVELSCYRFWSTKRQSLVSVQSSEEARLLRCRTNSPLLQQDAGLRKAMGIAASSSMDTSLAVKGDWKSSFRDVIQKLSLTDASKEGFKSTKAIVGREREMKTILSFLRHALKASIKEGHRSLFIAGPVSRLRTRLLMPPAYSLILLYSAWCRQDSLCSSGHQ